MNESVWGARWGEIKSRFFEGILRDSRFLLESIVIYVQRKWLKGREREMILWLFYLRNMELMGK